MISYSANIINEYSFPEERNALAEENS